MGHEREEADKPVKVVVDRGSDQGLCPQLTGDGTRGSLPLSGAPPLLLQTRNQTLAPESLNFMDR